MCDGGRGPGGFVDYSAVSQSGKFVAVGASEKDRVRRGLHITPLTATDTPPTRFLGDGRWVNPKDWSADDTEVLVTVHGDNDSKTVDMAMVNATSGTLRVVKTLEMLDPGQPRPALARWCVHRVRPASKRGGAPTLRRPGAGARRPGDFSC